MLQLLTHSRIDCFKTCRKKAYFAYELGIRAELDGKALRMGSAYHRGLELLGNGQPLEAAVEAVRQAYLFVPANYDDYTWALECETVIRLLCGYAWRWSEDQLEYVATERVFCGSLPNPKTTAVSSHFELAGKIDGIVKLADGRLAVKESKLLGDDIGPDADLWRRLRIDHQISLYIVAARRMGFQVDTVLYDATRKPTIAPTAIPLVDGDGIKIVLDSAGQRVMTKDGKKPRQTADKELGYVLQTRLMTVEEWGEKLNNDIAEQPDRYYVRNEVPRLDADLVEYMEELWDIGIVMAECQRRNRWYRTCNKNTCDFCPYAGPCMSGWKAGDVLPEGLKFVENIHPELPELTNGHSAADNTTA